METLVITLLHRGTALNKGYTAAEPVLASCLIYAWALPAHSYNTIVIVDRLGAFFFEQDSFDNSVPFGNTTPIYLTSLLWILGLGLGLDLELH